MKSTIIIVTLIIVMSISSFGQKTDKKSDKDSKAKEQVAALIKEYADALVKGDTATLERILAPEYGDITPDGVPDTKNLLLEYFKVNGKNNPLRAIDIMSDILLIRIYDNTAVVYVNATVKWRGKNDQTEEQRYAATLTAVKQNGQWQFVMGQWTEFKSQETKPRPSQ